MYSKLDPTEWIKGNQIRHFPTFYYCKVLTISLQKYMCILCVYVRIDCKSFQPYYYCNELIDAVEALISKFGFCRNSHRLRQRSAIVTGLTATIPAPLPSFLCTEIAQQVVAIASNKLCPASGHTRSVASLQARQILKGPANVCRPRNGSGYKSLLCSTTS